MQFRLGTTLRMLSSQCYSQLRRENVLTLPSVSSLNAFGAVSPEARSRVEARLRGGENFLPKELRDRPEEEMKVFSEDDQLLQRKRQFVGFSESEFDLRRSAIEEGVRVALDYKSESHLASSAPNKRKELGGGFGYETNEAKRRQNQILKKKGKKRKAKELRDSARAAKKSSAPQEVPPPRATSETGGTTASEQETPTPTPAPPVRIPSSRLVPVSFEEVQRAMRLREEESSAQGQSTGS